MNNINNSNNKKKLVGLGLDKTCNVLKRRLGRN